VDERRLEVSRTGEMESKGTGSLLRECEQGSYSLLYAENEMVVTIPHYNLLVSMLSFSC